MSEFDKILQDAQAIVSKEEAEKKRLLEEKQKELKQKEEQMGFQQIEVGKVNHQGCLEQSPYHIE